jgi:hypothetical protein
MSAQRPPQPDAGGAAEETQPGIHQVVVVHPQVCADEQRLGVLIELQATAFQQTHAVTLLHQPASQRDAGSTRASDADVGLNLCCLGGFTKIDEHPGFLFVGSLRRGGEW